MKRLIPILATALMLAACADTSNKPLSVDGYVDWLYASMPLPDSLTYSREYWENNVAKTLDVRERMAWNIPEREFRHFVLPLRVNNETLDDFRTLYADTLCARVQGLTIGDAALEINHWCHEYVTYRPSDARTSSPTATMRYGYGRCGEESVFTVSALRAAGIPARQVYTPRWAHTDDNHAWVEVFVDGKWYFMGACEPEPKLNMGWFNAPVSRAMLLHTNVYGDYHGREDVIRRTPCFTEINVISGYVPSRRTHVRVVDESGRPVEGASVEFGIYNYAEFYTVARYTADRKGRTALNTGCGDIFVRASKGDRFGFTVASGEMATVVLDRTVGEAFGCDVDIVPPPEDPIPTGATPADSALNAQRFAFEDTLRAARDHSNPALTSYRGPQALLDCLSEKDLRDVSSAVLEDALAGVRGAEPGSQARPARRPDPYVLSPRVELEALLPFREEVLASGLPAELTNPEEVVSWVRDNITVVENRNPQHLRIPPISVWRSRLCDAHSLGIFYVALCRTLGIPSRIDPVTGKVQYRSSADSWTDVDLTPAAPSAATTSTPDASTSPASACVTPATPAASASAGVIPASTPSSNASASACVTTATTPSSNASVSAGVIPSTPTASASAGVIPATTPSSNASVSAGVIPSTPTASASAGVIPATLASSVGEVRLVYSGSSVEDPMYYRNFTLARIEDGRWKLYEFGTDADETPLSSLGETISLDAGNYVLTTGTRLSDGSVLAHLEFFSVLPGTSADHPETSPVHPGTFPAASPEGSPVAESVSGVSTETSANAFVPTVVPLILREDPSNALVDSTPSASAPPTYTR